MQINIPSGHLHVVDRGAGIPLLLVHGFPLTHGIWQAQIEHLASHCRVIAPDLRGFGQSSPAPAHMTMDQYADDLAALLDAMQVHEKVLVCGLSMGGYVAWQFWKRHRQRLGGLIMADTRAVADTVEQAGGRKQLAYRVLHEGVHVAADTMLPRLLGKTSVGKHPGLVELVRKIILDNKPEGIAAALNALASRPDVTSWLHQIDVPTLVIVGEEDEISTLIEMESIAQAIPDALWVAVPQAGHLSPLENAHVFNSAVKEFLKL